MTTAERIAKELLAPVAEFDLPTKLEREAATELRRLSMHEAALKEFLEKTEWVQQTQRPGELGKHRADVLRERIETLQRENSRLYGWIEGAEQAAGRLQRQLNEELSRKAP